MIDERAIIDPSAKIAKGVTIGPFTIVGANSEIGPGTWIGPHAVIGKYTKIGSNNKIYQFTSIGEDPQHLAYQDEETWLEVGNDNIIREFVTIHRGTIQGHGYTRVGNNNLIMAYGHIAHDCNIGNNIILVNNASLAGHVEVGDFAVIGAFSGVHQFCVIGAYSFLARAAMVPKDVLPYVLVWGNVPKVAGLNLVGLKRRGFNDEALRHLRRAYNIIYRQNLTVDAAIVKLQEMASLCKEVQPMIDGLQKSTRGIVR